MHANAHWLAPAPSKAGVLRFWNFRTATLWLVVAAFGALLLPWRSVWGVVETFGLALVVYSLHAAVLSALGVALDGERISLPRSASLWPVLLYGRREFSVSGVGQLTALGRFMGAELVLFSTLDGDKAALFSSRAQRLAFFAAARRLNPTIEFYRAF